MPRPRTRTYGGCLIWLALAFFLTPAPISAQGAPESELTPAHELLGSLAGGWDVYLDDTAVGEATARLRLGGRFLEIEIASSMGPVRQAIYTFGFDDRHGHYTVIAMDQTGTYWVSAQGVAEGGSIPMYGRDDDPVMKSMGLEKEFVIHLTIISANQITIVTRFIDNRTAVRREIPFLEFELRR